MRVMEAEVVAELVHDDEPLVAVRLIDETIGDPGVPVDRAAPAAGSTDLRERRVDDANGIAGQVVARVRSGCIGSLLLSVIITAILIFLLR